MFSFDHTILECVAFEHALFFEKNPFHFTQLHTSYFRSNAQVMFQEFFCIEISNFTWDAKAGELL